MFFPQIELGGSQIGTLNLAMGLRELGVENKFYTGCSTAEAEALYNKNGFEIESYKENWDWGMEGPWQDDYAKWLEPKLEAADIIHAHHRATWWQAAQVIKNTPLVVTEHSVLPYSQIIMNQLEKKALIK